MTWGVPSPSRTQADRRYDQILARLDSLDEVFRITAERGTSETERVRGILRGVSKNGISRIETLEKAQAELLDIVEASMDDSSVAFANLKYDLNGWYIFQAKTSYETNRRLDRQDQLIAGLRLQLADDRNQDRDMLNAVLKRVFAECGTVTQEMKSFRRTVFEEFELHRLAHAEHREITLTALKAINTTIETFYRNAGEAESHLWETFWRQGRTWWHNALVRVWKRLRAPLRF